MQATSKPGPSAMVHAAGMDNTPALSTQLFRLFTTHDAMTVWRALTAPSGGHHYGAPIVSDWQVGSVVELRAPVGPAAVGEIVAAEPGVRLTHTLGDRFDAPAVYVSWTLHPTEAGTVVRLYVDEIDNGNADTL